MSESLYDECERVDRGLDDPECYACDGAGGYYWYDYWTVCHACSGSGKAAAGTKEPLTRKDLDPSEPGHRGGVF